MVAYLWILIPLAAIALAGFSEWLKYKRTTANLGNATEELDTAVTSLNKEMGELREDRKRLIQRIQNLEAIVTSEAWEALGSDRELAQAKAPPLQIPEAEEPDDAEQVARMAKRLRQ